MNELRIKNFTNLSLPTNIKGVLLDIDNTCYQYHPCHQAAIKIVEMSLVDEMGFIPNFEERYKQAQKTVKDRIPTHGASHSRILYFQNLLADLGCKNIIEKSLELETQYWTTFRSHMKILPGLLDFLADCQESGTKVVVISDLTTRIQFQKLIQLGIGGYIYQAVTAEEAGADKPDPAPFKLGLKKLECSPDEVIMIGDDYEKDIVGARTLGISTIQVVDENNSS